MLRSLLPLACCRRSSIEAPPAQQRQGRPEGFSACEGVGANGAGDLRHPSARHPANFLSSFGSPHDSPKWPHKGAHLCTRRAGRTGARDWAEEPKWDGTLLLPGTVRLGLDILSPVIISRVAAVVILAAGPGAVCLLGGEGRVPSCTLTSVRTYSSLAVPCCCDSAHAAGSRVTSSPPTMVASGGEPLERTGPLLTLLL